ncbi:multidrug efflux SMR transporter [Conexibacter sp. SYSU D00693]|uniref:DMT family transporter n=1 Tax=Conexibacter sp. SYSU D00693 TaxID=2812560 RepID=UPI00196B7D1B|nr:multidrug efflux SMR transporter [Conexibacter sp. SYSU D00693]
MTWLALFAAGALEVVWALALKKSHGLTAPAPTAVFVVAAIGSVVLLSLALRSLPVGTAYAIWTGTGAVGTALVAMALLGEPATPSRFAAIGLIGVGIVWLALVTEHGAAA